MIQKCKSQMVRHGIPTELVTNNLPQFSRREFQLFKHTTSSPHYPHSNGMAEKAVQTVKIQLQKAKEHRKDPYLALLEFQNTS